MPSGFTNFMQLPPELRRTIWEMALPGRRIFEPFLTGWWTTLRLLHGHAPPAIRGVCKESWKVTEDHGFFCFGISELNCSMGGCWFNPRIDLVYLPSVFWTESIAGQPIINPEAHGGAQMIRYLQWTGFSEV